MIGVQAVSGIEIRLSLIISMMTEEIGKIEEIEVIEATEVTRVIEDSEETVAIEVIEVIEVTAEEVIETEIDTIEKGKPNNNWRMKRNKRNFSKEPQARDQHSSILKRQLMK